MERRQFERKPIRLKVICALDGEREERIAAESTDVSLGGIGLNLTSPIGQDKRISMTIYDASSASDIEAKGTVVWQSEPDSDGLCRAGVQFEEIPWTQIRRLVA